MADNFLFPIRPYNHELSLLQFSTIPTEAGTHKSERLGRCQELSSVTRLYSGPIRCGLRHHVYQIYGCWRIPFNKDFHLHGDDFQAHRFNRNTSFCTRKRTRTDKGGSQWHQACFQTETTVITPRQTQIMGFYSVFKSSQRELHPKKLKDA